MPDASVSQEWYVANVMYRAPTKRLLAEGSSLSLLPKMADETTQALVCESSDEFQP